MSGLVGFLDPNRPPAQARQQLERMSTSLTRGGSRRDPPLISPPIYATCAHDERASSAILPFQSDGRYLWLDGEIFNREELCRRLHLKASSDPELLIALIDLEPVAFSHLRQLDGIFSAVLYDSRSRRVQLLTDRYGLRPLYWGLHDGRLIWCSEVKSFRELPGFPLTVDRTALNQFFGIGYLLEDRTWLEAVRLLPAATVLTWDPSGAAFEQRQYWSWNDIQPLRGRLDLHELAEHLGVLFMDAVRLRCHEGERIGLTLSGGLDSRAVLAAVPEEVDPLHTATFGQRDCADIQIAARVARLRGAHHHVFEITPDNWWSPRADGVWWTDGQLNLMHMHSIHLVGWVEPFYRINLHPFAGDLILGGSYLSAAQLNRSPLEVFPQLLVGLRRANPLYDPAALAEQLHAVVSRYNSLDAFWLQNRVRRFTLNGPLCFEAALLDRKPTYDNRLIEFCLALPQELRYQGRIYHRMLLHCFPDYYRSIPWQKTGLPITAGRWRSGLKRRTDKLRAHLRDRWPVLLRNDYSDYDCWTRVDPGRAWIQNTLLNPAAHWRQYLPADRARKLLDGHFSDGRLDSEGVLLLMTFELFLRRLLD